MSSVSIELRRIVSEWRNRAQRIREILNPPVWSAADWKVFACSLAILVQKHGEHWEDEDRAVWDIRWSIREGGELICQVEQVAGESVSVVVAQQGGFAGDESYTWLWVEFDRNGEFVREPYWVDGTWKDALVALLLPFSMRAGFYLEDRRPSPRFALGDSESPPIAA